MEKPATSQPPNLRITVEKPGRARLEELGCASRPIWTREPSTFDRRYDEDEVCYILEGDVTVRKHHRMV
jgi:uncharacterized cupin superfamily protein